MDLQSHSAELSQVLQLIQHLFGIESAVFDNSAALVVSSSKYLEKKGTIAPGKAADFVLLSRDPMAVPPEALREIQVAGTIKAGRLLYTP